MKRDRYASFARLIPQDFLRTLTILFVGAGSVGLAAMNVLAALGFGHFIVIDSGRVGLSNLAFGYWPAQVRRPKVHAAREILNSLNPNTHFTPLFRKVTENTLNTIYELMDQAHLVFLAIEDFSMMARLARVAYEKVPAVAVTLMESGRLGEIAWSCPNVTPCVDCTVDLASKVADHGGQALPLDVVTTVAVAARVGLGLCLKDMDAFRAFRRYLDPERPLIYVINGDIAAIPLPIEFDDIAGLTWLAEPGVNGTGRTCDVCRGFSSKSF
jgi:molybdopterin/thiamine biosynthesis adenylyltransferase